MNERLKALADAGVSIWLDDLSRDRIKSGGLADLIVSSSVSGVTTNPAIFNNALSGDAGAYDEQMTELAHRRVSRGEAVRSITATDVRDACDIMRGVWEQTAGTDGRVSIEVDPRYGRNTLATVAEAKALYWAVDRPNVLIKIPGTVEGLPAITETLANGISVNVTLIFSPDRYVEVMDAWLAGLEGADANGHDLSKIESVASFFVSRVDLSVDKALGEIGSPEATDLLGEAAIANARIAFGKFEDVIASDRWKALAAKGARPQRPLWASTGVKDPNYKDTRYVVDLVAQGCVNTMPEKTMIAVGDHGEIIGDTIKPNIAEAQQVFEKLRAVGVDLDQIFIDLEDDGLSKFVVAWEELLGTIEQGLESRRAGAAA